MIDQIKDETIDLNLHVLSECIKNLLSIRKEDRLRVVQTLLVFFQENQK